MINSEFRFPYDINISPFYELSYLAFSHATFFAAFGATAIDTLFYASAFNLSGHFIIIQKRMRSLRFERFGKEKELRSIAFREMRDLIQYHNRTIDLSNELTATYEPILFGQFLISSLQICVIAFQLTLVSLWIWLPIKTNNGKPCRNVRTGRCGRAGISYLHHLPDGH